VIWSYQSSLLVEFPVAWGDFGLCVFDWQTELLICGGRCLDFMCICQYFAVWEVVECVHCLSCNVTYVPSPVSLLLSTLSPHYTFLWPYPFGICSPLILVVLKIDSHPCRVCSKMHFSTWGWVCIQNQLWTFLYTHCVPAKKCPYFVSRYNTDIHEPLKCCMLFCQQSHKTH